MDIGVALTDSCSRLALVLLVVRGPSLEWLVTWNALFKEGVTTRRQSGSHARRHSTLLC